MGKKIFLLGVLIFLVLQTVVINQNFAEAAMGGSIYLAENPVPQGNAQTGDSGVTAKEPSKLIDFIVNLAKLGSALTGAFFVLMTMIHAIKAMTALSARSRAEAEEALWANLKYGAIAFGATIIAQLIQGFLRMLAS